MKLYTWRCPICNELCSSRRTLQAHRKELHGNKRVTKRFTMCNCTYCNREFTKIYAKTLHEKYCKLNPNAIKCISHPNTEEQKRKISEKQKERVKLGLNHGWMSCHSSKKSYPEEFFTKVIENEFIDKNYQYNYLFYQYRLDFAWIDKKKCIEIDGAQHERSEAQRESDVRKDDKLVHEGWQVLRIKWKDLCNDTQYYIALAKNFIDN